MKVLHALFGGAWGGGSVVVREISRKLIERGDEVWVVALDPVSERRFSEIGARTVSIDGWRQGGFHPLDFLPLWRIWRLCRAERFDLVVTHTSKGGVLGRIGARLAGTPKVLHMAHGYHFLHEKGWPRRAYVWIEKFAALFGDGAVCVSREHSDAAVAEGVERPDRMRTVYNGIDLTRHGATGRAAARSRLGFRESERVIGALGRIDPSKGLREMIEALPAIAAAHPGALVAVVGDGPYRVELEELAARLGVADRVRFLGFRSDIPETLAALDVFVQPSYREGLSVAVMEAMAARLPIVATDIVGNREQIFHERTGLLVPARDASALAGAVNRLLGDPALAARLGARAREYAEEHFDVTAMVERNIAIYDELTRRRPAPGDALRAAVAGPEPADESAGSAR